MSQIYDIDIKGKVIAITGSGGVLCSMFAETLASMGAKVALLDRDLDRAKKNEAKLVEKGYTAKGYLANVLDKATLEAAHEDMLKDFGPCDILINGAGGNNAKANTTNEYFQIGDEAKEDIVSFFDLDQDGVEAVFNLNFLGTLLPTQVFAKDMIGREGCSIVNISSMNAFTPLTKIPAYSGAKAAISNFTQWLAVHFANTGIRVNAIAPGFFVTKQNKDLLFDEKGKPKERANKIINATPMGRFGEAKELNGTLLYLIDPKLSGFVTGIVVPVDGGFSAYSGV